MRKEWWFRKRLTQTCPGVSRSLRRGVGQPWLLQGWGHWVQRCIMGPLEGGRHCLHYLHHSLASGQITGKEHSPALKQKIGWRICWEWPRPSEQDPVSPSVSLSHQESSINLLSFSFWGQTDWKSQSQKTNQSDHMDYSLVELNETVNHAM